MVSLNNQVSTQNCSVSSLKEKLEDPCISQAFIDVRTPGEYKGGYIHGVENVPLSDIEKHLSRLQDKTEIYVSCHNGMRTNDAVKKLKNRGLNAVPVDGGIVAWRKAGYPIVSGGGRNVIPVMRQVQLIFGSLILSGLALSQWAHPAFIAMTIFVGVGLLIAGSTGWCGFVMILGKLPWNRA